MHIQGQLLLMGRQAPSATMAVTDSEITFALG